MEGVICKYERFTLSPVEKHDVLQAIVSHKKMVEPANTRHWLWEGDLREWIQTLETGLSKTGEK